MEYGQEVRRERHRFRLPVGATRTITITTVYGEGAGDLAGTARNVTTGSGFLGVDPKRDTIGTCSAAGTTQSIVDSARTEADDHWKYVRATLRDKTDGKEYTSRVTGNTASTTTLAVDGFPVAPAYNATASDTYVLHEKPLLTWTAAGISANNATVSVGPANLSMYAGRKELHYYAYFSATDAEWFTLEIDVE